MSDQQPILDMSFMKVVIWTMTLISRGLSLPGKVQSPVEVLLAVKVLLLMSAAASADASSALSGARNKFKSLKH